MASVFSGCSLLLGYGEDELNSLMNEMTVSMFAGDGISINILLENPETMGLSDQPATLPLPNFDKSEYESNTKQIKQIVTLFKLVSDRRLSARGKLDKATVIDYFGNYAEYADFYYLDNRDYIGTNDGWNVILPLYLDKLAFKTENDVKNWISLLNQTKNAFSEYARFESEVLIPAGYGRSATTYNDIATQCEGMTVLEESGDHFLYGIFVDKIDAVEFLDETKKVEYGQSAKNAINVMIGAYENLAESMKNCAKTAPATEKPLAQYKEGKAYYELLFKTLASTSDSVATAYNNLAVAFNEALAEYRELTKLLPEGYQLEQDMSMETLKSHYALLKEKYTEDFPALNVNTPDATFHTVPTAMADVYNPASYFKSAVDSISAPETIYINESNAGSYLGFDIISHEGIPGHMLQHAYYKSTGANTLRTILGYTGYAEGWATYVQYFSSKYYEGTDTEKIAYKAECYYTKAMMYLSTMIDIQINYYGKTIAELEADEFYSQIFDGDEDSRDTYNYMVQNPAVYTSYGYGNYKMEQLRGKFNGTDLEFHTAVLSAGPTTYEILENYILGKYESNGKGSIFSSLF